MNVKLIHVTPKAEELVAYCARVSSPNQENKEIDKLLAYLIKHKHWSPYEIANMCLEIITTRAIAPQILRHRSFSFQEFSQRYAEASEYEIYPARRQDLKNRQNSTDDLPEDDKIWFKLAQETHWEKSHQLYKQALKRGVAKELARNLLPLNTVTKLYMNGNLRSWMHFILLRTDQSTQLEHRLIAEECKRIFVEQFPVISKGLGWL